MKRWMLFLIVAGCWLTACETESSMPTQSSATKAVSGQITSSQGPHGHASRAFNREALATQQQSLVHAAVIGDPTITFHGGPVVLSQRVASIYWSNRTIYRGGPAPGTHGVGSSDGSLIGFFLNHLAGSPYYAINSTYHDSNNQYVQNNLAYTQYWAPNTGVPATGSNVLLSTIEAKIEEGFSSGALTFDANTVYLVFTDSAVNQDNLYPSYCAEHGHFTWNGHDVRFEALPRDFDHPGCRQSDAVPGAGSPNNDAAADEEVNHVAHETDESNTDPDGNAWFDAHGNENADKCNFIFGVTYTTGNGAKANLNLSGKDFLIQQNWQIAHKQGCEVRLFTAAVTGPYEAQPNALCYWTANPSGGTPPYTYAWFGNSNFYNKTLGYANSGSSFYASVDITDANGVTQEPQQYVDVRYYYPRCG